MLLTNNPRFLEDKEFADRMEVCFFDEDSLSLMKRCRSYVQNSYALLTHPMYGNFKASELFYRSFVLEEREEVDVFSLELIENAVNKLEEQLGKVGLKRASQKMIEDYSYIDYEIIMENIRLGGESHV